MGDNDKRNTDWKNRILCSDESCIGVIGTDGRCKECGKPYEGELPDNFSESADSRPDDTDPSDDTQAAPREADAPAAAEEPADSDQEWEQRILCRDEACIGVIGVDGKCKECGLPIEEE